MPPPYRAAVFDMDGLLLDTERPLLDAWLQATREHGHAIEPAVFLDLVGRGRDRGAKTQSGGLAEALGPDAPFDAIRRRAQALIAEARERLGYPLKPGAAALLRRLEARRVPLALATSTRRDETLRRLAASGLAGHFRALACGDEIERGKPAPDVYLLAAERIGIAAPECLAFEDSEHGAGAALAAGMGLVVVPDLKRPHDTLLARADAVMVSLDDGLARVEGWFGMT